MQRDSQWSFRREGCVLVMEFPHGTALSPGDAAAFCDRWRAVTAEHEIDAVVLRVPRTVPCSDAGRGALREAVRTGIGNGIRKWALVAERPKRRYLKRTVDLAGVHVEAFNTDNAALAWAERGRVSST